MNIVILSLGGLALFLIVRHVYCAVRFGTTMKKELGSGWNPKGSPKAVAYSHSDLERFMATNKELIDGNAIVRRCVVRFERSWKYAIPMILVLFVVAVMLQRIFPPPG